MEELISYCGLKCNECDAYKATMANDAKEIERLSKEWTTDTLSFTPEQIWCDGCIGGNGRLFNWCNDCTIRNCASERQVANCAHCDEFPCQIIEDSPGGAKERLMKLM